MSNSLELSPRGLPLTFAAAACARQLSWNLRVLVHRECVSLTTRCLVHGAVLLQRSMCSTGTAHALLLV